MYELQTVCVDDTEQNIWRKQRNPTTLEEKITFDITF